MQVIVNADDFGLSENTVAATIACFEAGLLTSATIMARAPATQDALAFARTHDHLSFGVHLTFVGDGSERAVSPPATVVRLALPDGRLRSAREIRINAVTGRLDMAEIERETRAQVEHVRAAGVDVSHVDSHKHIHKLPVFQRTLRGILPQLGITHVRNVQDIYLDPPRRNATFWLGGRWRRTLMRDFVTTDHFYMPSTAHDRDWHRLVDRLAALPGRTIEVGVHPGSEDEWRRLEQESLPSFVEQLRTHGHELARWRDV